MKRIRSGSQGSTQDVANENQSTAMEIQYKWEHHCQSCGVPIP